MRKKQREKKRKNKMIEWQREGAGESDERRRTGVEEQRNHVRISRGRELEIRAEWTRDFIEKITRKTCR